jgi:hypothetical protein
MPCFFATITAVERLAAHSSLLDPEFARALGEDLEYARFGALFPELPWFGVRTLGLDVFFSSLEEPRLATLYSQKAPVAFALKTAELVSNGALVGVQAGHAFLAGYVTQLCVKRALEPLTQQLMASTGLSRNEIEWKQGVQLMNELHGNPLIGTRAIRAKLQARKASGLKGVGRGFYELIRMASLESFGEAPTKTEVDTWMRGLSVFSFVVGTPLGKFKGLEANGSDERLYRSTTFDVFAQLELGLKHSREVLLLLGSMLRRNSFTVGSKRKLFALLPEGAPVANSHFCVLK